MDNKTIILKGALISMALTVILLLIFALILVTTNIQENSVSTVIVVVSVVSTIIGSCISTKKTRNKGIITGGIVGIVYVSIIYLISSIVGTGFALSIYSFIMLLGIIGSGMLGGIIGVNMN